MAVDDEVKNVCANASQWIVKPQQAATPAEQGVPKQLQPGLFPPQQLQPGLFPPPPVGTCAATATEQEAPDYYGGAADPLQHDSESEDSADEIPSEETLVKETPAFAPMANRQPAAKEADSGDQQCEASGEDDAEAPTEPRFVPEETVLIFDWDDTVLPSTWVQHQGLRLDEGSELNAWQREQLVEVANVAAETLRIAKQHGTVVLVTNAERGWIELSCQKFMPTLSPSLENVKVLSARTAYEGAECLSPCDWKLRAFESEIRRIYGSSALGDLERRKNVLSLGDSVHEREALLRATSSLPNCRSKSLKFVERPDIAQICKQHSLVTSCFDRIVHHDGNLDLCIRCA